MLFPKYKHIQSFLKVAQAHFLLSRDVKLNSDKEVLQYHFREVIVYMYLCGKETNGYKKLRQSLKEIEFNYIESREIKSSK